MPTYLIKIESADPPENEPIKMHYFRRFDADDIARPITVIDKALNTKPRKPRRDIGQPRKGATA